MTARPSTPPADEAPPVALLRRLADPALVRVLQRPGWHLLCDAPMAALFHAAGLPAGRMTQALEHGAILADDFVPPWPASATLVIATRRSEQAVAGVLRTRGIAALPMFGALLPRLAAGVPPRLGEAALDALPAPGRRLAIVGLPWSGAELLSQALERVTGLAVPDQPAPAVLALAEAPDISGFDLRRWWAMLTRARAVGGSLALRLDWLRLSRLLDSLTAPDRAWLERQLAGFAVLRLRRDPLEVATAIAAAETAGGPAGPRDVAVAGILTRRAVLSAASAALDGWLAGLGARVVTVDCADLAADPAGVARRVAGLADLALGPGGPDGEPLAPLRPPGLRFDRLLAAARAEAARADGAPRSTGAAP